MLAAGCLFIIVCISNLHADEKPYRLPLNIDNGFSSSFQEFRSNHFHGGLDLRTYRKTGYPVYAVSDGYIFKIRVVKRGSGRGLYLKHNDGNISIYFHLDRFETRLENLLKRLQKAQKKKYIGNYFLKQPITYKKGQVIAYSGETGSGFPHLHLEIRDNRYFALNPFQWIKLPKEDGNLPVLKGVLLRSRGSSTVNGTAGETFTPFRRRDKGIYVIDKPILVTGHFDLVLSAYDRSDVGRHVAPYSVSASIDNRLYYRLSFDRFERDDNNQLGFVYDMSHSNSGSYFFNLFSQKGFALEQQAQSLNPIIDSLEYGEHELRVRVEDNNQNVSVGIVPVYKVKPPLFKVSNVEFRRQEKSILLDIDQLDADPGGEIKIAVYDERGGKVSSGGLKHHRLTETRPLILKGVAREAAYIDFDFYLRKVHYLKKRYLLDRSHLETINDIEFETYINRDDIYVRIIDTRLAHRNLQLKVVQGEETQIVEPEYGNDYLYFRFRPLNRDNNVLLHFSLLKGGEKIVEIQKRLNLIFLEEGVKQSYKYHEFEAYFAVRSVYEPKVLKVEEREYASDFPVLSRQVSLMPDFFPFLDTVYYKFKKKLPNPRQVGIFKYDPGSGKWRSRFTQYDEATATYKHRLISSGVFALMRDIFPPQVRFLRPRTKYKRKVWRLSVKIWDKGKGVDDSTIKTWLNGKRICTSYDCTCEYDPDWSLLKIEELDHLKVGKNQLKVQVKDYAGNITIRTFTLYLK
jgi:hypothetical protein